MKNSLYITLIISILSFACTDNFEEINSNPNEPQEIAPQFLLSNVISVTADESTYNMSFRFNNYLAQYSASVEFENIDRYVPKTQSDYWNLIFSLQSDLQSIRENPATNEAYIAVADILSSYLFSQLTDMWGDVPYTEATKAKEGIYAPKYDTQESIYLDPQTGILAVLARSANTLATTNANIEGDMMFDNDLEKWERFANSLLVRYYLRISKRITDFTTLQNLANSGRLMLSNDDNALVPYLASAPNQWPMSQSALGLYQEHRMTLTADSVLSLWNDPRRAVLYKPTQQSITNGNPEFKGLLNGQNRETISSKGINLNDISLFGAIFRDVPDGVNGQFMQYAELQFALAEAVERGFISGDAQSYYENGVKASFEYYNTEVPANYFDNEAITLNGEENLTKILTQKWLSLFVCGHEAWYNIRRTGIPYMKPGPDNENEGRYPVRYLYPDSEQATNAANFQQAVERIGGNNQNSKGWWERD